MHDHSDKFTRILAFTLLLIAVAVTFIPFLGMTLFTTKGEPREAVVALSMLQSGNWVLPMSCGDVMPYKPPMLAWCIALLSLICGGVTEVTSRLPSALATIVLVMVSYRFWVKRIGAGTALVGAVILFTSFEVYRTGMSCRVDMLFTMFMVLGMYGLYRWSMEEGMHSLPWWSILWLSGATLTKGPAGIVLPCLVTWITVALCGHKLWRCTWKLCLVALASMVLPAIWYLAAYERGGQAFLQLVADENFKRMTGNMTYDSHVHPWWYNLTSLLGGMAPYTLLVAMSLFCLLIPNVRRAITSEVGRWRSAESPRFFMFIAPLVVLVFYCIPASKRSVYLLPMYPFLAMQVGVLSLWLCRRCPGMVRSFVGVMAVLSMGAFTLFCLMHNPAFTGRFTPELSIEAMQTISGLMSPAPVWQYLLGGVVAATALVVFIRLFRDSGEVSVIGMFSVMITLFWAFGGIYQPAVMSSRSDKGMADEIAAMQPKGKIYDYVSTEMLRPFTINFYLSDRLEPFTMDSAPAEGLLLVGDDDAAELLPALATRFDVDTLKTWNRLSCDTGQKPGLYHFRRTEPAEAVDTDAIEASVAEGRARTRAAEAADSVHTKASNNEELLLEATRGIKK